MALSLVNRNSVADVLVTLPAGTSKSYKAQFSRFGVRAVGAEIDVTTFAGEVNGEFDVGPARYIVTYAGITKTGIDGSNGAAIIGAFLALPQGIAQTWQWHTGSSVAGTFNVNDFSSERIAGATSVFAGSAISTGSVTIAWPIV